MQIILTSVDESLTEAWRRHCGELPGVRVHHGSILDLSVDAVVSPANSFGFIDGGIDALYVRHFGRAVQDRLQCLIRSKHQGELLVGSAEIVPTEHSQIPFLIAAPTMRVPMLLQNSVNPYLAARAALLLIKQGTLDADRHTPCPLSQIIRSVAFPGMGTGVGGIGPHTCARQVRIAIEDVVLDRQEFPETWADAQMRHQALYTDRPRNLQLGE